MGWANHRANRLVDLAALTFRTASERIAQGVEVSALHSFGCTAALRRLRAQKKRAGERTPTR